MTRKDFERAAKIVAKLEWPEDAELAAACFAELFQGDNPRFDPARFRVACGLSERVGSDEKR
jgi:hypothetical protein